MRIPESVINEITERLSLSDVVGSYVRLERRGNRYWGLCPFHSEKTPSFTLLPDERGFHCFGCQKGGSMFSFVQEIENLSFPEAVEFLAQKAGVVVPKAEETVEDRRRTATTELYNRVAGSFHHILLNNESAGGALQYLEQRGIDRETIEEFQLGYAPQDRYWLHRFLLSKNYSEKFLAESGLFSKRYPNVTLFSNRVLFPIRNLRGAAIAFGGRLVSGDGPKYINSPDTEIFSKSRNLYGLHNSLPALRKNRKFVIVEGYLDVIAFHRAGVKYCVAPLGTALTDQQVQILKRYTSEGLLVFDGDAAGLKAAERGLSVCEKGGVDCSVIALSEGSDPAEIVEKDGPEALKNLLEYPINGFTFIVEKAKQGVDVSKASGKEQVVRHIVPFLTEVQSEVRREAYIHEVADALQVDPESVQRDITRIRDGSYTRRPDVDAPKTVRLTADLFLMLAVAANSHMFKEVRGKVNREDLEGDDARALYVSLEEAFRSEENSLDAILGRIESDVIRQTLMERKASGEFSENIEAVIRGAVSKIRERVMRTKRNALQEKIRAMEKSGGSATDIRTLLEDKMFLDTELEKIRGRNV
jgi:DNA primase